MKIKVLLIAAACSMGALGAYAQKGVDNGTQFGSGEDSIRCITNISLFVPYAKAGNFKDAYDFWKIVYDECPAATKDIYLHGVKIMAWKIANEKDPAKKAALIDDLMGVYDKRVKYFGDDKRYGKDWIVSRKAQDYIQQMGDKADYNKLYNWLGEIINEYGDNTEALGVSLYMFASYQKMADDPNHKGQYVEDYLKASKILDTQLQAAQAANNEKEVNNLTTFKTSVNGAFANSGAADCETLQNLYAPKVEDIFPEYYVLRVDGFNQQAKTPLDEWIAFLKTGEIDKNSTVHGLQEARERLRIDQLDEKDRRQYYADMEAIRYQRSVIKTGWIEGRAEGIAEGKAEGIVEGRAEGKAEGKAEQQRLIAINLKQNGVDPLIIARSTGLSIEEIEQL